MEPVILFLLHSPCDITCSPSSRVAGVMPVDTKITTFCREEEGERRRAPLWPGLSANRPSRLCITCIQVASRGDTRVSSLHSALAKCGSRTASFGITIGRRRLCQEVFRICQRPLRIWHFFNVAVVPGREQRHLRDPGPP
ncbi:hypothetical protein EYF80_035410 [Liparis tanakae]|uniref:Uncharacterized protein n=1 Tax=Liparis tanakae TaxID=230148 RepID=A0A4Z2GP03_9TELE|nr:hypothetical protein EYF80_035410 [Liparis tanakae]